jgi:hypothetical protein
MEQMFGILHDRMEAVGLLLSYLSDQKRRE